MNKTTIKISVLAFLGFMTYGYAQQQQQDPYKGKVGVNTVTPSATMDVQPNNDNARVEAKTNEGIIAPKLSKTRIANIATPVEGTLVYATDATYTAGSDATVNNRVAKITEKGYYFYNGTEWVKAGSDVTQQIWQKQANKDILLVDNDIESIVMYKPNGGFTTYPKDMTSRTDYYWDNDTRTVLSGNIIGDDYSNEGTLFNIKVFADKLPNQVYGTPGNLSKNMFNNVLHIDNLESSNVAGFVSTRNAIKVSGNSTKNYKQAYASTNYSQHFGTGKINMMIGSVAASQLFPNSSATRMVGAYNEVNNKSKSRVEQMEGAFNYLVAENEGFLQDAFGSRNFLKITKESTGTINWLEGFRTILNIDQGYTGTINNYTGTRIYSPSIPDGITGGINNMYGLFVGNINKGKQKNYSIYTEAGQIRFGDLVDANVSNNTASTTDKPVYVTADGVLKVGGASGTTSKWTNDTANNVVKLTNLSDGTTLRTDDKNVFIDNEGNIGIGTKVPDEKLSVESTGHVKIGISTTANGSNAQIVVKNPEKTYSVGLANKSFVIYDNKESKYRMRIDEKGNTIFAELGSPVAKVDIRQKSGIDESVLSLGTLNGTNNKVSKGIQFFTDNSSYPARIDVVRGGSSQETGLAFLSSNKVTPMEQMRITPIGNIGIGTTTPTEKLDVAGNIKSSSLASTGNRHVYADANGVLKIGTTDVTTLASLWTEDVTNNSIKLAVNSDGSTRSNVVSILDDGKVHASSFMGTNGATIFPDYVFQKYYTGTSSIKADYNFKSLSQVEDFVKANGHLPGYKSAATIKAQGYVDLMETQLTNVEKIEELYLHSIEQDKVNKQQAEALKAKESKIQELEAKNAALESRLERLEKLIQ